MKTLIKKISSEYVILSMIMLLICCVPCFGDMYSEFESDVVGSKLLNIIKWVQIIVGVGGGAVGIIGAGIAYISNKEHALSIMWKVMLGSVGVALALQIIKVIFAKIQ